MYPDRAFGRKLAALLADQCSLVHDYVARQKVGGTHLKYHVKKQLLVLPPERYTAADLDFIVPRVLELTYTANDLADWARDLGYIGAPFAWDPIRRAQLRAELDACYARLYGLTRDELRYVLDPADVMGADYPSETFRVLKNNETRAFGEYRTQRLVLEAWDAQEAGTVTSPSRVTSQPAAPMPPVRRTSPYPGYSPARVPCCEAEDWLAGLVCDVLLQFGPISEATLRIVLTSPLPAASSDTRELSAWTAPERMSRLPAVIAWLRDLPVIPRSGNLQIVSGADLSAVLGDSRTQTSAAELIGAYKAHQAALDEALSAETFATANPESGAPRDATGGKGE
jgi:hypothetical protein